MEFIYDDGGRKEAGFGSVRNDCLVRALAISTGIPYQRVWLTASREMKKHGFGPSGDMQEAFRRHANNRNLLSNTWLLETQLHIIRQHGYTQVDDGPLTCTEAGWLYPDCLVTTSSHIAAIVSGKLHDISDWSSHDEYIVDFNHQALAGITVEGVWTRHG